MKTKTFILVVFILTLSVSSFAQKSGKKYYITGQVLDINDKPVSGAMVLVDNKSSDVITDDKGMYKVKVKADAATISIFNISCGLMNEEINGRIVINFKLNNEISHKETVKPENTNNEVVDIGYGSVQKKYLAGSSVGNINGQNNKYASYQNIFDLIKGEIAGVQVSGKTITIRGVGTITASSNPLVIVDGIEQSLNEIDTIDPRMVKSINILKGSDASIYGSKGANGVILITLIGQ